MDKRFPSFTIIILAIALSVMGLALIPLLPVKLNSSRTLPQITVSYSLTNASGRVVESEVTSKIEAMLSRIKGVKDIASTSSSSGGSYITMEFDKSVDMDVARFEVSTAIRQLWPQMPDGLSYPSVSAKSAETEQSDRTPFMTYTINAPEAPFKIQQYVENNIKPELARLEGISMVNISGATPMEWVLEYNTKQLEALGITTADIQTAVSNYTRTSFLGMAHLIDNTGDVVLMRLAVMPESKFDLESLHLIPVKKVDGNVITLDKLVRVIHQEQKPSSYYRINGLNTVSMSLFADKSANQLDLSKKIKADMDHLGAKLPQGFEISLSRDSTEYIRAELDKIYFRSGLTIAILLLFVLIVSRSFRYLAMITFSMAANLAIAVIFYYMAGVEIHLKSLAGITISLCLIMDNTIVMADQLKHRQNFKAFLAILAATLTTISAIVVVFFLPEEIKISLEDFSMVIIINLAISLFVALFLVPALMDKFGIYGKKRNVFATPKFRPKFLSHSKLRGKRSIVYLNRFFVHQIGFIYRHRVVAIIILILAFGLPVFKLPEKVDGDGMWAKTYNKTLGSPTYKEKIKPIVDKSLGGALRLFSDKVSKGSYYGEDRGETTLSVSASMPSGSTLEQMNAIIVKMESYLSGFPQIRQFQSSVYQNQARMTIYFTKAALESSFPMSLKNDMTSKATELGGAQWSIYGVGDYFSNRTSETAGNVAITIRGYNYDQLWGIAEAMKKQLETNQRIKEVTINSQQSWSKDDYTEFSYSFDREQLVKSGVNPSITYRNLFSELGQPTVTSVLNENYPENVILRSARRQQYDAWSVRNSAEKYDSTLYKLAVFGDISKAQAPQAIRKKNQQYTLVLQYDYIGSSTSSDKVLKKFKEDFEKTLPVGYSIDTERNWFWKESAQLYFILAIIAVIIFFICSILFNSLRQPFAVIMGIPISFIGLFLTYYLFDVRVDDGCFASMILLSGITVNASIYIINDYNNVAKMSHRSKLGTYKKAFNSKITSIMLTVLSTVLGFVPFLIGSHEGFWYPMAMGTIGGLILSLAGIYFYLPLFMGIGKDEMPPVKKQKVRFKDRLKNLRNLPCKIKNLFARIRSKRRAQAATH